MGALAVGLERQWRVRGLAADHPVSWDIPSPGAPPHPARVERGALLAGDPGA